MPIEQKKQPAQKQDIMVQEEKTGNQDNMKENQKKKMSEDPVKNPVKNSSGK